MDKNSPRYPYTYAADHLRLLVGPGANGISCKISRSDASLIRREIAEVMGVPDKEVAEKLADRYLAVIEAGKRARNEYRDAVEAVEQLHNEYRDAVGEVKKQEGGC